MRGPTGSRIPGNRWWRWRRLAPGETDHELLWLTVLVSVTVPAIFWLQGNLPVPGCPFAHWTGVPCPTCGGTRALRALISGQPAEALFWNPLITLGCGAALVFALYAALVLALRLPRLRLEPLPEQVVRIVRLTLWTLLGANWLWLLLQVPAGGGQRHGKPGADLGGGRAMHAHIIHPEGGQPGVNGGQGERRCVAIAGKVPQHQLAQIASEQVLQDRRRRLVGEMTVPGHDPLFH